MHAQHRLGLFARRHQWIPVAARILDRRQSEHRRVLRKRNGGRTSRGIPSDFRRGQGGVPKWDKRQRDVPAGRPTAPFFDHPVVVRLHAKQGQLAVLGFVEDLPAKAGERGEAHRREHARSIHIFQPSDGVVASRSHLVVGDRLETELLAGLAGHSSEPGRDHSLAFVDPGFAVLAANQTRRSILELRRHTVLPHMARLEHVVIDRNDPFCPVHVHLRPLSVLHWRQRPVKPDLRTPGTHQFSIRQR